MERCDSGVGSGGGVTTSTSGDFVSMVSTISATAAAEEALVAAEAAAMLPAELIITVFVPVIVDAVIVGDGAAATADDIDADDIATPLLRKTRIDCVLSRRFKVCSSMGPSTVDVCPFFVMCCCTMMDPSGRQVPFFRAVFCIIICCGCCCMGCCIDCCCSIIVPLPDEDDDEDCSKIVDSFDDDDDADSEGTVVTLAVRDCAGLRRACCNNIDLSSSFSRLSSSWLF